MKILLAACLMTFAFIGKGETSFSIISAQTTPPRMAVGSCQSDEEAVAVPLFDRVGGEVDYSDVDIVQIEAAAFANSKCPNLQTLILPGTITALGDEILSGCNRSVSLYFQGDKPSSMSATAFKGLTISIHYFPTTSGWNESETTLGGAASVTYVKEDAGIVHSVDNLMFAIRSTNESSVFKLSSNGYFLKNGYLGIVIPSGMNLTLDLYGMKMTAPVSVKGNLKVVDTSDGKCGFINHEILFDGGKIEFDLHNVATVSTPVEFNNVANMNALGADINMKLGCDFGADPSWYWPVQMLVPPSADVTLDMNQHGISRTSITVEGKLKIIKNLYGYVDLYAGGLNVQDGGKIEYTGVRTVPILDYSHLIPGAGTDDAFNEVVDLLKHGATITADLIADVTDTFEVPAGTSLTIDLDGHTLRGGIEVNGKLKVKNSFDERGGLEAKISIGSSGEYESTVPKTVSAFAELTSALGSSAGSTLNLKLGSDITGDVVEIPVSANITLDLSGRVLTCDKMKVLGGLTLVDSAGTSGYIKAGETYIGRKGFVKIAYGPLRTTLTYLSQGLMLMFR